MQNDSLDNILKHYREIYKSQTDSNPFYWEAKGIENRKMVFEGALLQEDKEILYMNTFLNLIKNYNPNTILEAGVGYGRVIRFLRDNISFIKCFAGSDISSSQIQTARDLELIQNNNKSISYIVADTCNLPYAHNEFDLVYTYGSLMHIHPSSIEEAIKELLRVTKNYLIICEANSKEHANKTKISYVHPYNELTQNCGAILEKLIEENVGREDLNYKIYVLRKYKQTQYSSH
jgi:ubiquinone/menaquinone biosynthesis C-methylase UbiE